MLKYRVERLREILDPNYKLELPEQLAEGTEEPKTIIRSNDFILDGARGPCEIVTEPDEDGTGTKVSFKNPTYNKDLPGYGTFGRDKDGKEALKHNKKAFTNPTKWGIDDANKLQEIGCDFTRWAFTTHPTAGYVTTATIHLLNTHQNHQMILRAAVGIGGVFTEYQPTSTGHTFTIQYPDHPKNSSSPAANAAQAYSSNGTSNKSTPTPPTKTTATCHRYSTAITPNGLSKP